MYHCCSPCVCDTKDLVKIDTKQVVTATGSRQYHFAVIGNPCSKPEKFLEEHADPFGDGTYSLSQSAPDLRCRDGFVQDAVWSDNGYVIIGLLHETASFSASDIAANDVSMASVCQSRADAGYNSGMGTIFRLAAGITPIVLGSQPQLVPVVGSAVPMDGTIAAPMDRPFGVPSLRVISWSNSTAAPLASAHAASSAGRGGEFWIVTHFAIFLVSLRITVA
jgi:hypothetical protein